MDEEPQVAVQKFAAYIQVSEELAMDYGLIPDTRPPPPPVPWRRRLRWRVFELRERFARWAFRRIAGYDMPEDS